ncbi:hypothetical protein GBAR_LOCUS3354 [Geodia barretti]|uniref:Uncharacterized protein n=1 Tax=Geodia barretti TaxID=519541 RepID=A0AA35R301_GEOBA|nr:hypothetical protein GBAR_LOCUS3354 [Geodia barretti]
MFAKLKKKVLEEEEAAGGPERLSFSPRKFPGGPVAVRSPPAVGPLPPLPGEGEEEKKPEGDAEKEKNKEEKPHPLQSVNLRPTAVPSHLQSSLTQEDVHQHLLVRIDQLQQELDAVNQRHEEEAREHQEEREKWREETAAKLSDKDRVRYNYHGT